MHDDRVSTLELFFDLVFVFTITQITTFLVRHPSGTGIAQAALLFGNLWWMFGGYAWLTNAVPPRKTSQRLLILVAMGGFLAIALAVPDSFGSTGIAFGAGYLLVTLVHTGLFLESTDDSAVRAMKRLGPFNLVTAAMVLAGGFPLGAARWALWSAAFVLHWITPFLSNPSGIGLRPAHFVERHGLILLIALGESVVAVGTGLHSVTLTAGILTTALLGLVVTAALWWLFFDEDDDSAERALAGAQAQRRAWLALYAFGYAFLLVIPGIVVFAAGVRLAAGEPSHPASAASVWFLAAGVSVYCVGLALLRRILSTGGLRTRILLAALVLGTPALGVTVSAEAELGLIAALLIGGIIIARHFAIADRTKSAPR